MSDDKRRGRPRTGTIEWHGDHWDVRPTLADGQRGDRVCQPVDMSEARARDKARALTELAAKHGTKRESAPTPTPALLAPTQIDGDITFGDWSELWCADRESKGYTSVDDDRGRLRNWIWPRLSPPLGSRSMKVEDAIKTEDIEDLVADLDARVQAGDLSWKTAKNIWGLVTKMFKDAVRSKIRALRVRKANPTLGVAGPDEGTKKLKTFLYPSEFVQLVECPRVPLRWKRLFAIATYPYLRAAEIRGLEFPDVDLDHRSIMLHRAVDDDGTVTDLKGEEARRIVIEPTLYPLLVAMKREAGDRRRVIEKMPPEEDLAEKLRHWLKRAGITREELFVNDATRKWITFHDLRATGITWRAVRGDDPIKIMRAAGHKNMTTTNGYIRTAEQIADGFGDVFPPLPQSLISARILPGEPDTEEIFERLQVDDWRSQRELNPRYRRERPAS